MSSAEVVATCYKPNFYRGQGCHVALQPYMKYREDILMINPNFKRLGQCITTDCKELQYA